MSSRVIPSKTWEMHNHHIDSTVWNDFAFRDGDIVIANWGKSGTTWLQQIVGQMLFGPDPDLAAHDLSPWVELRAPPKAEKLAALEAQTHRRFLKTHLPISALRFSDRANYIYIARDGRDVVWSLYNHHVNANALWYRALNDTPGRIGPPIAPPPADIRQYFREWLQLDGYPFWPFWDNVRGWWDARTLPNVMFIHYADLKRDMSGVMKTLARYLGVEVDAADWPAIERYCSFDWMKANAAKVAPLGGAVWDGGAETFIHKGTNGRWRDVLSAEDSAAYEARALAELGDECATWLAQR